MCGSIQDRVHEGSQIIHTEPPDKLVVSEAKVLRAVYIAGTKSNSRILVSFWWFIGLSLVSSEECVYSTYGAVRVEWLVGDTRYAAGLERIDSTVT